MAGTIGTVGIIGAGQMGGGIAQVAAIAGYKVLLYDISSDCIEKGLATVSGNMARMVGSRKAHRRRPPGGARAGFPQRRR